MPGTSPKPSSPRRRRSPSASAGKRRGAQAGAGRNPLTILWVVLGAAAVIFTVWLCGITGYSGRTARVIIPAGTDAAAMFDTLSSQLGPSMATRVKLLWKLQGGDAADAHGYYEFDNGTSALTMSRRLAKGRQTPVNVTFNNIRLLPTLAERLAARLELTAPEWLAAADSLLSLRGWSKEEYPAAFIPDTYSFYWTDSPATVAAKLIASYDRFWTPERLAKADALGLTPQQVASVAAIVEEETAKADERPLVARLYLNRLARGMRLQADPTVKFATGNFSLRRITAEHLRTPSPYNTYLHTGLTPGPIRIPEAATLDAVLSAPPHDYIYMCAREDFSGYHRFATDYATHVANARRYRAALDSRGIK